MAPRDDLPTQAFPDAAEWAQWLEDNQATSPGLWLKIAKKASGVRTVSYAEAVEVALCYGWIDSQKDAFDEQYFVQRFTPRKPKGKWSKINRAKAEELIAQGAMRPAGLREVEAAKVDGRWEAAYDSARTSTVPLDLQQALDADPAARESFEALNGANRYAILYRLQDAKRPETRQRRLEQYVTMLHEGRTIHPQ